MMEKSYSPLPPLHTCYKAAAVQEVLHGLQSLDGMAGLGLPIFQDNDSLGVSC